MKKLILTMLTIGFVSISANAAVSILPTAYYMYSDNGSTLLPTNSMVAWIVDVDGDGFGDWDSNTLTGDSFTIDDDDLLLGVGSIGALGDGFMQNTQTWSNVTSPDVQGKDFAMLWFDTAYVESATGAGEGVNYGIFVTGEVVPSEPATNEPFTWATSDAGGSLANDTFYANYTTAAVPEPATIALLIAGGAAALARRKRRG